LDILYLFLSFAFAEAKNKPDHKILYIPELKKALKDQIERLENSCLIN